MIALNSRRSDVWQLVKDMKDAEIPPNQVTCSILLKSLNAKSAETDILLTMDLIESIEEPMDEVMLSSVVEACVRIGKPDLLVSKLEQLQAKDRIVATGSHTCGSLIKAYGHARDLEGVWRCWKEMRSRLIKPTSITLGCMIEAVVNNGDTEGAFELIHDMQKDEQCRDTVNSVIYCSILKGFAREKKLERVWDVYEEMSKRNVEMSLITFNTILDACARSGRMEQLPKVMQDMKRHHVEPNIVTYSTILKGHCQSGDVQLAFSTLKDMKRDTGLKPDEIMYNSLLDGCAKSNLYDEAMDLFEDMQKQGISPSNFTLSIMVKLFNRAGKVEQAFNLVRDLPQKYKFRPNVHVFTNLMQCCIGNRQQYRALTVLETMVKDRVQPDCRTYAILVRASLYQNNCQQAAALLRTALGLPGALDLDSRYAACAVIDAAFVNETLTNLVDYGCAQSLAAPVLADIKKSKARVSIDQGLTRRIMSGVAGGTDVSSSKGKGKGRYQKGSW
jgi:pentatricopeptide repeat protein